MVAEAQKKDEKGKAPVAKVAPHLKQLERQRSQIPDPNPRAKSPHDII
jgi:hypothetical protein